jgi:hypothetical protein
MVLKGIGCEGVDWINVSEHGPLAGCCEYRTETFGFQIKWLNFFTSLEATGFSEISLLHWVYNFIVGSFPHNNIDHTNTNIEATGTKPTNGASLVRLDDWRVFMGQIGLNITYQQTLPNGTLYTYLFEWRALSHVMRLPDSQRLTEGISIYRSSASGRCRKLTITYQNVVLAKFSVVAVVIILFLISRISISISIILYSD